MSYVGNNKANAERYACERDLLLAGFSYLEIAEQTNERQRTISERNRLVHKVNIWDAFASRCKREGIPCRMPDNHLFCSWFTGFFDGEGCIVAFTRPCTGKSQYSEFRLQIRIQIREDDISTIQYIRDNMGCGILSTHIPSIERARPSISWCCETIKDLMEIVVPSF